MGKKIRVYDFEFNSFVLGDFSRWGMRFQWEIKDEYPPYDTFVLLKTEFNNLSFDISSMTWVIVRHWTRKFLIVAISSDYFKHVRILVSRFSLS
ncbi:unnamed protein product [Rhizophagus irregularis]|nr:unnamed protein product [Rhizophagus irregularis]